MKTRRVYAAGIWGIVLLAACATPDTGEVLAPLPIPPDTAPPPSQTDVGDADLEAFVVDCARYVPFKAVLGDPAAVALWARVGQAEQSMMAECDRIATIPKTRQAMQKAMTQLEEFFAATATEPTVSIPPSQPDE